MNSSTFLQIFLMANVFLIGALTTLAIQYGLAHFRPAKPEKPVKRPAERGAHLPPEMRDKILHDSQADFEAVLDRATADLQHDLDNTTSQINKLMQKISAEVIGNEMERYRLQLEQIRKDAEATIGGAQSDIAAHQQELKQRLAEHEAEARAKLSEQLTAEKQAAVADILAEKQQILSRIDTKLADAVASFLMETLQHEVDLGAQSAYLVAQLEEHKAELAKGVSDES